MLSQLVILYFLKELQLVTMNTGQVETNSQPHGPMGMGDPEKRKMIQNQLIILIHAAKCQKLECNIPYCQTMKNVLLHLPNCQMGRNCTVQHCASSRQIIAHWKQCKNTNCPVCQPLKPPQNQSTASTAGPDPTPPTAPPTDSTTDWRSRVDEELRQHLVKKLVSAIFPPAESVEANFDDEKIRKLYNFAKKVT